jgi:citrate lyase subunit beta / citryl-CoA lyase
VLRRSQLYVPGNNEKMIYKAATLDADSVILDLEDAVPDREKVRARGLIAKLSKELDWGKKELCVRVNAVGTIDHPRDLSAVKKIERLDTVLVPKAEGDCSQVGKVSGKALLPIVETAKGLMTIKAVARSKKIVAITYGAGDYASSVGGSVDAYLGNATIKTMIVAAARANGVEPIDNVYFDLENPEGFREEALASRSLGFVGKQVVHPSQVPISNEVFSSSKAEIDWATKIISQFEESSAKKRGALRVEGSLVDAVHYRLAKGILERRPA